MLDEKFITSILEEAKTSVTAGLILAQLSKSSDLNEVIELAGKGFKKYKKKDLINSLMALVTSMTINNIEKEQEAKEAIILKATFEGVPMCKQAVC